MRRWLVVLLALLLAAGAVHLLLAPPEPATRTDPEHPQIDPESRAKLREVLREDRGD